MASLSRLAPMGIAKVDPEPVKEFGSFSVDLQFNNGPIRPAEYVASLKEFWICCKLPLVRRRGCRCRKRREFVVWSSLAQGSQVCVFGSLVGIDGDFARCLLRHRTESIPNSNLI